MGCGCILAVSRVTTGWLAQARQKTVKVVARLMHSTLISTFDAWKRFVAIRRSEKDLMRGTINRMKNSQLLIGWNGWRLYVDSMKAQEAASLKDKKEHSVPGVGSILLEKAQRQVTDTAKEIRTLLDKMADVDNSLDKYVQYWFGSAATMCSHGCAFQCGSSYFIPARQ